MRSDASIPFDPKSPIPSRFSEGAPQTLMRRAADVAAAQCAATLVTTALLLLLSPGSSWAQSMELGAPPELAAEPELPTAAPEAATVESWLYAIDDGRNDGSGTLFRIGTTPSGGFVGVEVVGETGVRDVFDIAFLGDRLFGVGPGTTFGITDDVVIEIDPNNGVTTPIGSMDTLGSLNALEGESATTLIGATSLGQVWRIDPDALVAFPAGSYGSGLGSSGDLALTPGGTLYGTVTGSPFDRLATISRSDGRATLVGSIGFREAWGLAVSPVTGELLGVVDGQQAPKLVSINRTTGAATVIGAIPVPHGITGLAAGPAPDAGCPSGFFGDSSYPDFCFRVRIGAPASALAGTREPSCLQETVCVSGAVPGRSEIFLRIIGPRPNGFLWPTIVRFTPSRVAVDIRQKSSGKTNQYVLPAIPPGVDELSGLQDRTGFMP